MGDYPRLMSPGDVDQPPAPAAWAPSLAVLLLSEKLTIATVLGALLGVGVISCAFLVPQYRAESLVLVEPRQPRLVEQSTVMEPLRVDNELLLTEAQLIESQGTMEAVTSTLRLGEDAEFATGSGNGLAIFSSIRQFITDLVFQLTGYRAEPEARAWTTGQDVPVASAAATILARHVAASPIGKTYLIAIDATSSDPLKAAVIANSVADHYIADRTASRVESSEAASAAIRSRLTALAERLRQDEMALAEFKAKSGLVQTLSASGTSAPILQHELSDASTQLNDIKNLESKLAAKLAQLSGRNGGSASADALASPLIQQLREHEATLAANYAQVSSRLGPNHPETRELRQALAAIRAEVGDATADIRRSLAAELAGVRGQEQLLEARLATMRARIAGEAGADAHLASLQADVESSRTVYEAFLARFKATTEQRHLEQPIATVVSMARVPQQPYSPRLRMVVPGLIAMSAFGAVGAGLLRAWLRRGFWSPSRVAAELGVREVVTLPALPSTARPQPPAPGRQRQLANPATPFAEALSNLSFLLSTAASGTVVLVTSSVPNEGKTLLADALAAQTASRGKRTLLVDCDLYKATAAPRTQTAQGLSACLTDNVAWEDVVSKPGQGDADVVPRGTAVPDPTGALASPAMAAILGRMRACYDLVILDGPPVLMTPGVRYLAAMADQTVFVVRFAKTQRAAVRAAMDDLALSGAHISATVLTFADAGITREQARYRSYEFSKLEPRTAADNLGAVGE